METFPGIRISVRVLPEVRMDVLALRDEINRLSQELIKLDQPPTVGVRVELITFLFSRIIGLSPACRHHLFRKAAHYVAFGMSIVLLGVCQRAG